MGKAKRDRVAKGERRLSKAQAALKEALDREAKADRRAKKAVDRAQAWAEQVRATAHARVEQCQQALTRAEARLSTGKEDEVAAVDVPVLSNGNNGLTPREAEALEALQVVSQSDGAVPGAWQRATGLSNGTFSRVRLALMDRGLVVRNVDGGRNIRYALAQGAAAPSDTD